jgi:hypothetical protein
MHEKRPPHRAEDMRPRPELRISPASFGNSEWLGSPPPKVAVVDVSRSVDDA